MSKATIAVRLLGEYGQLHRRTLAAMLGVETRNLESILETATPNSLICEGDDGRLGLIDEPEPRRDDIDPDADPGRGSYRLARFGHSKRRTRPPGCEW